MIDRNGKVYVAGHRGMVGSAIVRLLERERFSRIVTRDRSSLDLRRQGDVEAFFDAEQPDTVVLAAARVGGIEANRSAKGDFILENLQIEVNVLAAAHRTGVSKLLFLGSSCIYPKLAEQPIREDSLLTGPLEETNEPYAIAKIAGLKTCTFLREQYGDDFISMMPTNLYGPYDNFDPVSSHVMAALIRKFVDAVDSGAAEVVVWGTGTPRREFLHVDDAASAALFLLDNYSSGETINVGWGEDISILELAEMIAEKTGFAGTTRLDEKKPDGTPRKLLDTSKINDLGWHPAIGLEEGLDDAIAWYRTHRAVEENR